ncbi:MAG: hypothetical protein M3409_03025, partial [Gemmatimonadota bacterium]|nr:hypothetical protein [Gemmatimonadota bacterium]
RLVGIIAQADVATEFGGDDGQRDQKVADTVEQISQSWGSGSRGGQQQPAMQAGGSAGRSSGGQQGRPQQQGGSQSQGRASQARGGTEQGSSQAQGNPAAGQQGEP